MQKYTDVIFSTTSANSVVPLAAALVTVNTYPGGVPATIYSDNGVTPLTNPFASDSSGRVSFYAADGRYSITVVKTGYGTVTVSDILLEDPANPSAVKISGGSVDSTPVGASVPSTGAFTTLTANGAASIPNLAFIQSGTGAVARTVQDKSRESVSVLDFGADPSYSAAVNTVAIQKALDAITISKKRLFFPAGTFQVSASLLISEFNVLYGEGKFYSVISGLGAGMTTPIFVNAAPAFFGYAEVSDMQIAGGTYAFDINVTSETAFNRFTNVSMVSQTNAQYRCNKLMQTTTFTGCRLQGGNYGIDVLAWTSNHNNFIDCEFAQHAYSDVRMKSSEVNNFIGCLFGGGGVLGRIVIDVTDTRNMNFQGCYFENGHQYLLSETGSSNSVSFNDCHFTGAISGANKYEFLSDGRVNFGTNNWYLASDGAPKMYINGTNNGKLGAVTSNLSVIDTLSSKKISSGTYAYPVTAQKDLVTFACAPTDNALSTIGILTGTLTLNYQSINTGGTSNVIVSRKYHVMVASRAGLTLISTISLASSADSLAGSTLTVSQKTGATAYALTLELLFTGNATPAGSVLNWAFESDAAANAVTTYITPSIA